VGVIQSGDGLCLAREPRFHFRVAGEMYGKDFDATLRFRCVSRALYTSPWPPAPMERISYGPSFAPEVRVIF
jgi:hypothetical protein